MNQSNDNVNPLQYYPDMPGQVTGRDAFNFYEDRPVDKLHSKGAPETKHKYRLSKRRYTRLPEGIDDALDKAATEQGIEIAALIRHILIEWLKKNNKI